MKKYAVYTSIFNKYDKLREPRVVDVEADYYCFTDDPDLKSKIWRVIRVDCEATAVKMNRQLKMLIPELILSNYTISVYIDGNIQIRASLPPLIEESLADADLAIPIHPERDCAYDEIEECLRLQIISEKTAAQWTAILDAGGLPRKFGLFENNVLIRRHSCALIRLMHHWYALYDVHGGRDQFSLTLSCHASHFPVHVVTKGPRASNRYFGIFPHNAPNASHIRYLTNYIRINRTKSRLFAMLVRVLDGV